LKNPFNSGKLLAGSAEDNPELSLNNIIQKCAETSWLQRTL